ncbi:MAG: insulinase family protein, partial [Planctomycetales bacterium]|nr:insulinase family protein [Planctomycetales bacterium]
PSMPLDRTYTTEPPQDGERTVVLRRVGNTQYLNVAYHVPSAANREFAAVEMLAYIFGTEPSGRLYRKLVVPELATSVSSMSLALHDPGLIFFSARVPVGQSIESARLTLLQLIEDISAEPITENELNRAKAQFLKDRDLRAADTRELAIDLSEWAAQGDWRLYFLFRDYVEQVTQADCMEAAKAFLTRNNRTLGLFIPSEASERVQIPSKPNLEELLADYTGQGGTSEGESLDLSPLAIESRVSRGRLSTGLKTIYLPKKTRGQSVNIEINLRYGNEASLENLVTAIEFLPDMLQRGTQSLNYEQLQDKIDLLRSDVSLSGTNGLLSVSIETKREYLGDLLPLVGELLKHPRFDPQELEVLRRQAISGTEARMTEPSILAGLEVRRRLSPYPATDVRYVPTLQERIERYQTVTVEQLRQLHNQLDGRNGEIVVVGDFDSIEINEQLEKIFDNWTSTVVQERIAQPAQINVPGEIISIETPDKANAVYYAGEQIAMRDDDNDYPALVIGNYILGGGALSSRLADRVRQTEGLSYNVGSGLTAHPIDTRTSLTLFAITNPEQRDRIISIMQEELLKLLQDGVTEEELSAAKQGYLQSEQLSRTQDSTLAALLASTAFANRDMSYFENFEQSIAALTVEQTNAALRKYIDPQRLVVVTAGDFAKTKQPATAP